MEGRTLGSTKARCAPRLILNWLLLGIDGGIIRCRCYEYALGFIDYHLCCIRKDRPSFLKVFKGGNRAHYGGLGRLLAVFIPLVTDTTPG